MYVPADDTFFLSDIIKNYKGNYALEIGIGSGYLTNILCENFKFVIGTDIDFTSITYSKNQLKKFDNKFLICCNVCEPIKYTFDIIISNPPYLPMDSTYITDKTIFGVTNGIEVTIKILQLFKYNLKDNGKIIFIVSSLSNNNQLEEFISFYKLKKKFWQKRHYFTRF